MKIGLLLLAGMALLLSIMLAPPVSAAQGADASFTGLDVWKNAIVGGDAVVLKQIYSQQPQAHIETPAGVVSVETDINFWIGLKARSLKMDILQSTSPQPGLQQVVLQAEVRSRTATGERTVYISEGQLWQQQAGQWRLLMAKRTNPARLQQPTDKNRDLYPAGADARAEIKEALRQAARGHKRVLVVFGANWCYDCHVLDLAFHRPDIAPILNRNYEVVHVDVGEGDKNQELMKQYQVPMARGIPGLAVLESDGSLLYSQKNGEFEKARSLAPEDLLQFLSRWKPQAR
jgi:hypothetical protein